MLLSRRLPTALAPAYRALAVLLVASCSGTEAPRERFLPKPPAPPPVEPDAGPAGDGGVGPGVPSLASFYEGCGSAPASGASFTRRRLRQAALRCTSYHLCGFDQAVRALQAALTAREEAADATSLAAAQRAFLGVMALWSRIEVMQYGPLGSPVASAGEDMFQGENLRDQVYAWPLVSRCRVDEQVVGRDYEGEGVEAQLVSAKGLFALEYLLFSPSSSSACAASSETAKAFDALRANELEVRRRAYAEALTEELSRVSARLRDAYAPDGPFGVSFVSGSGYPNEQEALNALAWGLIYIEREVKDWKLGIAAGLTASSPVTEAESPFSGISARLIEQNLLGFASLFEGCGPEGEGIGFDDWLEAAGHADLAADILKAQAGALAAVRRLPAHLAEASEGDVGAAYQAVRAVTTLLKADLFGPGSPLNLALPASVEGDTD